MEHREQPWDATSIIARATVQFSGTFNYSNIGYLLLRLALEDFHGQPFHQVLDNLVFRPLEILACPFSVPEDWKRCTHPAITDELRTYHPVWIFTGTFDATPEEGARGVALIMQNELGAALPEAMLQTHGVGVPQTHPMAPDAGYGLGLMTHGLPPSVIGFGGQGPGFNHFAAIRSDGSRWAGGTSTQEGEDQALIRRCMRAIED